MLILLVAASGGWWWFKGEQQGEPLPTLVPTAAIDKVAAVPTAQSATPVPTPTPTRTSRNSTPTPRATATRWPTSTPSPSPFFTQTPFPAGFIPSPTPWPRPQLQLTPGDPQPYLETYRLVAFYGSPPGPALGVLGAAPRPATLLRLRQLANEYHMLAPERYVLPTFHIVTTIADPFPGKDGDYNHWLSTELLEEWLVAAESEQVAVVLDVQPGYADLQHEFARLRPLLLRPHVQLALDPEFAMADGVIPGRALGHLHGEQLNWIQAQLNEIALEIGINKVLIVHQFASSMVLDKEGIIDYPHVELVIDADGFGSPGAKKGDYLQYASEPGFEYGGFKLFYNWDFPLLTPAEVLAIDPRPAVIIYQ